MGRTSVYGDERVCTGGVEGSNPSTKNKPLLP